MPIANAIRRAPGGCCPQLTTHSEAPTRASEKSGGSHHRSISACSAAGAPVLSGACATDVDDACGATSSTHCHATLDTSAPPEQDRVHRPAARAARPAERVLSPTSKVTRHRLTTPNSRVPPTRKGQQTVWGGTVQATAAQRGAHCAHNRHTPAVERSSRRVGAAAEIGTLRASTLPDCQILDVAKAVEKWPTVRGPIYDCTRGKRQKVGVDAVRLACERRKQAWPAASWRAAETAATEDTGCYLLLVARSRTDSWPAMSRGSSSAPSSHRAAK